MFLFSRMDPGGWKAEYFFDRLCREELLRKTGRGRSAQYSITPKWADRVKSRNPEIEWNRPWDGRWRSFGYDVKEIRRRDRKKVRSALHARHFGLLQKSLWISPHPIKEQLREILECTGIPECFCGFDSDKILLCTHQEIVRAAWNFDAIAESQEKYLVEFRGWKQALNQASDWASLASVLAKEQKGHEEAFCRDPLLPRVLWLKQYRGAAVQEKHARFCLWAKERAREISVRPASLL